MPGTIYGLVGCIIYCGCIGGMFGGTPLGAGEYCMLGGTPLFVESSGMCGGII